MFCRWVKSIEEETKEKEPEDTHYAFKLLLPTTWCVAPIVGPAGETTKQYWAVGQNCCSRTGGYHCGDSEAAGAHSGSAEIDTTGEYYRSVKVGELAYGWHTVEHPMFVKWSKEILVPPPGSSGPKLKFGKGVFGHTSKR